MERERKRKLTKEREKNEGRLGKSPLVFFPLFRSLYFSLALHYLNAWNRLDKNKIVFSRKEAKNLKFNNIINNNLILLYFDIEYRFKNPRLNSDSSCDAI